MGLKAMLSRAPSFAHLEARARAQDDNDKRSDDDTDKDENARRAQSAQRAQNDDDDRKDDDNGDDKGAQDDDNKPDDNDDSGKGKRSKRARARSQGDDEEAQDDDDESEMRGSSSAASARRREQARCAAIFETRAAGRNPAFAAQLAFTTRLPRYEAIALLEAAPVPASSYPSERAARNPRVGAGMSLETASRQAIASGWDRAFAQVTPQTGPRRAH